MPSAAEIAASLSAAQARKELTRALELLAKSTPLGPNVEWGREAGAFLDRLNGREVAKELESNP